MKSMRNVYQSALRQQDDSLMVQDDSLSTISLLKNLIS